MIHAIWNNPDSNVIFFHNTLKTILFEKRDEVKTRKDLRGISVIPACNMTLKKIIASSHKQLAKGKLSMVQFGLKDASNCEVAKLLLNYRVVKNGIKKL